MSAKLLLSLSTSIGTILAVWLVGRKDWRGWLVGLVNQIPWITLMVITKSWGLSLLIVVMSVIHVINIIKWRRDHITNGDKPSARYQAVLCQLLVECHMDADYFLNKLEERLKNGN